MPHTVPPETSSNFDSTRIIERPDGFYWQDKSTEETFGPFPTLQEAIADMEYGPDAEFGETESVQEAEQEIGIADWLDPDTGMPAEESVPRLEDH